MSYKTIVENSEIIVGHCLTTADCKLVKQNIEPALEILRNSMRMLVEEQRYDQTCECSDEILGSLKKINMLYTALKILLHPVIDEVEADNIISIITDDDINYIKLNKFVTLAQTKIRTE